MAYATALRYNGEAYQWGAAGRGLCVCALWAVLAWFPPDSVPRASAQMLPVTLGAITTWAHYRPGVLDRVADSRFAAVRWLARHLSGAKGRATVDLSGVLECGGILAALLLYVGPVAVRPLPAPVFVFGLAVSTVHVWTAMSQAMIDAGWYNPDAPPARQLVRLRPLIPPALSALGFALFAWPLYVEGEDAPMGVLGASLLAASFLLLWAYTFIVEALLRSAVATCHVEVVAVRRDDAITLHSLVKNAVRAVMRQVAADPGVGAETRAWVNELALLVEEARMILLDLPDPPRSVPTLVDRIQKIMPRDQRQSVTLAETCNATQRLSRTDYGLVRRVLPDLITNSWKAGAQHVDVSVQVEGNSTRPWVSVRVEDDGPGLPPGAGADPHGSLRILKSHLRGYEGTIEHHPGPVKGTCACVRWKSVPH
ncbi:HAMP domain-containing histidine kinase [Streptomyces sp. HB-N217]|uniref:HAMP domain-containing histidine kinase n=1 Tax=Streptomyces sp. HB-N217 TaxID=2792016 RepID=UPI0018DA289E|nr:HAMP domain-containing histidine kinase [Streptomyces sp. HB-N217]MBH5133254.1 HAMP domain-containing histidine kinase [Streptomyces sp. HB-N217]